MKKQVTVRQKNILNPVMDPNGVTPRQTGRLTIGRKINFNFFGRLVNTLEVEVTGVGGVGETQGLGV
jgi:hypothetical protein